MKKLTEKQLHNYLNKYYKNNYGERDTDEWHVNPDINIWVFERDNKIITLKYNMLNGEIEEKIIEKKIK